MNDEVKLYSSSTLVSAAMVMTGETLQNGGNDSMYVSSGGTANSTTINADGRLLVLNGGIANDTNLCGDFQDDIEGVMWVYSDGIANRTSVNSGGYLFVSAGGTVNNTIVNSLGQMAVGREYDQGGTAYGTTISRDGELTVAHGGIVSNTVIDCLGSMDIGSGGSANRTTIRGGLFSVQSALLCVHSAGKINHTNVDCFGSVYIYGGGMANSTTVYDGGRMYIYSGGIASSTFVNPRGYMDILSGGIGDKITVNSEGFLHVYSGGTAYHIMVNRNNAGSDHVHIHSGGTATLDFNPWEGRITLDNGAIVSRNERNAEVYYLNQSMETCKGDIVSNVTLGAWQSAIIYSDGKMENLVVQNGGMVVVSKGGTVNGFSALHDLFMSDGIKLSDVTVSEKAILSDYGVASNVQIKEGGQMFLRDGARASQIEIDSGSLFVGFEGIAENLTVSTGGVYVATGGEIKGDISVSGTGGLYLYGGSIVEGEIHVKGTLYVDETMVNNGSITVDLNESTPSVALIQNLDYMSGTDNFTVETGAAGSGLYALAGGASNYDGTVTIENDGTKLGSLSVGETKEFGGVSYSLTKDADVLNMRLDAVVVVDPVFVTGNFTGTGGVFELQGDGTAYIHTASAKTQLSGSVNFFEWEIVGVGDFNGTGHDGVLWVENSTGYTYMQYDMSSLAEVSGKKNCLGVLGEGYTIKGAGDFSGSGIDGALLQGPAFGDKSISLNYGLPVWARESDGTTFNGWLGALVNTWQEGDALKGDLSDPASINANNYQYEVVGVGDFNGDGRDDVMLQNTMPKVVTQGGVDYTITGSGDVFTFLTGDEDAIKRGDAPTVCYAGCATNGWEVVGFGDFDNDGMDDTLLSDGTGLAGWKMANGQRQEDFWFGNLTSDQEFAGVADFNNDGTDDILVRTVSTGDMNAWLVNNGTVTGSLAIA